MNERIKDIAVAAGAKLNEGFYGEICGILMSPAELEKFAELLIQECAIIANRAENTETELRCMYDVITEHFGVEE